ncbi:MAG TPA: hypothetical protein VJQ47_02185 [Steroidobacteraceae bacterium]|nr:hypothetical protein [Steroidobacteraceae bacterium]
MKLLSRDGSALMEVRAIRAEGANLVIEGTIMGAMPIETVITPTELRRSLKMLGVRNLLRAMRMLLKG